MKRLLKKIIFLSLLSLFSIGCDNQSSTANTAYDLTIVSKGGKEHEFKIEIALSPEQQEHGLMNRTEMAPDAGMLFVFGTEAVRSFWMKDTLIPLDMVFIRKDGTIHRIHSKAKPNDRTSIGSGAPVTAVLELNGGTCDRLGIKENDKVVHPFFQKTNSSAP